MTASSPFSDDELERIYAWPNQRSFRLNMLIGTDGLTVGADGTSNSLTSTIDRTILRTIRRDADVVIAGAASIRAEGWFLPPHGRMIVLSRSGNLPMDSCPDPNRVFIASDIASALHNLRPSELRILCEGGITTATEIQKHAVFDEIALSTIGTHALLPEFLNLQDYNLVSSLEDDSAHMTFRFWRRAVKRG